MQGSTEAVNCNLCGKNDYDVICEAREGGEAFNVVRCKACGLNYLNPRLTPDAIGQVYASDSLANFEYYLQTKEQDEATFSERLRLVAKFTSVRGKVLDIGSSIGSFLAAAKREGWEPHGIELNKKSAEYSKKTHSVALFDSIDAINTQFHLINMSDVIEHFPDPKAELLKIRRLLEDGGLVLISTPDFDNKLTRKVAIKPREHLYYFDSKTIKALLEECGFEVLYARPTTRKISIKTLRHSSSFNRSKIKLALFDALIATGLVHVADFVINRLNPDLLVIASKRS